MPLEIGWISNLGEDGRIRWIPGWNLGSSLCSVKGADGMAKEARLMPQLLSWRVENNVLWQKTGMNSKFWRERSLGLVKAKQLGEASGWRGSGDSIIPGPGLEKDYILDHIKKQSAFDPPRGDLGCGMNTAEVLSRRIRLQQKGYSQNLWLIHN